MNYQGLSLPKKLLNQIDEAIENKAFTSKIDFIKHAIRNELQRLNHGEN